MWHSVHTRLRIKYFCGASSYTRQARRAFRRDLIKWEDEMSTKVPQVFRRPLLVWALAGAALLAWGTSIQARVTKIVVDTRTTPAFGGAMYGNAGQYETLAGRVFGELD